MLRPEDFPPDIRGRFQERLNSLNLKGLDSGLTAQENLEALALRYAIELVNMDGHPTQAAEKGIYDEARTRMDVIRACLHEKGRATSLRVVCTEAAKYSATHGFLRKYLWQAGTLAIENGALILTEGSKGGSQVVALLEWNIKPGPKPKSSKRS